MEEREAQRMGEEICNTCMQKWYHDPYSYDNIQGLTKIEAKCE